VGFFRSFLVPATKKESIFTKEGVFGCDVFNLRFWKLRRSTLLREVVSAAVEIRRFLRRSLIFQRQEKAGGFFTAVRKNKWIFFFVISKKQVDVFKWQTETFCIILPDAPKLFIVVSDQAFSILPMIFQLSSLKTLLSRTEAASRILFLGKDQGAVTVTEF
jgi:hypothetical protein